MSRPLLDRKEHFEMGASGPSRLIVWVGPFPERNAFSVPELPRPTAGTVKPFRSTDRINLEGALDPKQAHRACFGVPRPPASRWPLLLHTDSSRARRRRPEDRAWQVEHAVKGIKQLSIDRPLLPSSSLCLFWHPTARAAHGWTRKSLTAFQPIRCNRGPDTRFGAPFSRFDKAFARWR